MRAAKYIIEAARLQKAQILCIQVIASLPYGYGPAGSLVEQYFEDAKHQAQSWFNKVIEMAKNEGINDVKTDIFIDVKSITGLVQ